MGESSSGLPSSDSAGKMLWAEGDKSGRLQVRKQGRKKMEGVAWHRGREGRKAGRLARVCQAGVAPASGIEQGVGKTAERMG